jgi:hypothetical protein
MNTHILQTFHAKTQRRETEVPQRQSLLASPQHRSLSTGPGRLCLARFGFAPLRLCIALLFLVFVLLALAEQENDDGRMHSLEVRVRTQDEKGKTRKLAVSSRQGYYMSTTAPKETTAAKSQ